jgi:hypothetical protein
MTWSKSSAAAGFLWRRARSMREISVNNATTIELTSSSVGATRPTLA